MLTYHRSLLQPFFIYLVISLQFKISEDITDLKTAPLWPPNSNDFNPVDCKIWGII